MMWLCSRTTECSTSESMISQSFATAVNGPTYVLTRRVRAPMIAGPRTFELTSSAPSSIDDPTVDL